MKRVKILLSACTGVLLLVIEGVRFYNEGIYADTHGSTSKSDWLDALLLVSGLLLIAAAIWLSRRKSRLPSRKK